LRLLWAIPKPFGLEAATLGRGPKAHLVFLTGVIFFDSDPQKAYNVEYLLLVLRQQKEECVCNFITFVLGPIISAELVRAVRTIEILTILVLQRYLDFAGKHKALLHKQLRHLARISPIKLALRTLWRI